MQTKIEARNTSIVTPHICSDLVDAVLPAGFPFTTVMLSDKNSYDKILSSRQLRSYVALSEVQLIVNDIALGTIEALQFLDKTKNAAKWKNVYITNVDSPYAASPREIINIDAVSGNVIIVLPGILDEGVEGDDIMVVRADSGVNTNSIDVTAAEGINGQASIEIRSQYEMQIFSPSQIEWNARVSNKAPWNPVSIVFADSPYAALVEEFIEGDPTAGDIAIPFPDATLYKGFSITVKKLTASANKITPTALVPQLIDGAASIDMTVQDQSRTFTSNGTGWSITGGYL